MSRSEGKLPKSLALSTCMVISKMISAAEMLSEMSRSSRKVGRGTTSITTMTITAAGTPKSPTFWRLLTGRPFVGHGSSS